MLWKLYEAKAVLPWVEEHMVEGSVWTIEIVPRSERRPQMTVVAPATSFVGRRRTFRTLRALIASYNDYLDLGIEKVTRDIEALCAQKCSVEPKESPLDDIEVVLAALDEYSKERDRAPGL